jgi:hypothetical protein
MNGTIVNSDVAATIPGIEALQTSTSRVYVNSAASGRSKFVSQPRRAIGGWWGSSTTSGCAWTIWRPRQNSGRTRRGAVCEGLRSAPGRSHSPECRQRVVGPHRSPRTLLLRQRRAGGAGRGSRCGALLSDVAFSTTSTESCAPGGTV